MAPAWRPALCIWGVLLVFLSLLVACITTAGSRWALAVAMTASKGAVISAAPGFRHTVPAALLSVRCRLGWFGLSSSPAALTNQSPLPHYATTIPATENEGGVLMRCACAHTPSPRSFLLLGRIFQPAPCPLCGLALWPLLGTYYMNHGEQLLTPFDLPPLRTAVSPLRVYVAGVELAARSRGEAGPFNPFCPSCRRSLRLPPPGADD